ncbi:MAG: nucleotidyltransferase domain-containing protein [Candidatus Magasanikbacteria bacterium]|nr:nucleotidyltransferase domain-containing protein [Candidatus Magasanikbacteria bacterium]
MKLTKKELQTIRKILKQHEVKRAELFGSYARGEAHKRSDVDLLIEFHHKNKKSLLDLSGLLLDLQDNLHKKVDVVTSGSIHPRLKPYIEKDLMTII